MQSGDVEVRYAGGFVWWRLKGYPRRWACAKADWTLYPEKFPAHDGHYVIAGSAG